MLVISITWPTWRAKLARTPGRPALAAALPGQADETAAAATQPGPQGGGGGGPAAH